MNTPMDRSVPLVAESEALHERVRRFALGGGSESFEELALALFEFQRECSAGYRRLLDARSRSVQSWADIPPVPVQAFRVARVAMHPAELDEVRFVSSGTTSATRSVHAMRTTATYDVLSLAHGRRALRPEWAGGAVVVALAPLPEMRSSSSLGHMMRHFIRQFDGLALTRDPVGVAFDVNSSERWLLGSFGVDVVGLRRAARIACSRDQSLLVLGTSLALAMLIDALDGEPIEGPKRTIVMQTGGFKGRSRVIPAAELRRAIAETFRIPEAYVVSEYGMTELTSQLYDGALPGSDLGGEAGIYHPPPWLRVVPVDPVTLEPTPPGEPGLGKFVDLGNVDSAVAIVTEDVVRAVGDGFELLGRRLGAPARGCSLSAELVVMPGHLGEGS